MPPACRANRMRPDEEEPACGCRAQKAVRIQAPCTPQARSPLRCAAAPVLGFLVIGGWRAAPGGFAPMRIACSARSGPLARPLLPVACRTRNQPQILRAGGGRTGACRAGQRGSSARHAAIPRRQGITARRRSSLWTAALCASAMAALGLSVSIPAAWAGRGRGAIIPSPPCGRQGCGTCAARAASPSRSSRNHPPPRGPCARPDPAVDPSVLAVRIFSGTGPAA